MNRHRCRDCGGPIPNGEAYIRSECFEQAAWCGPCWAVRQVATVLERVA